MNVDPVRLSLTTTDDTHCTFPTILFTHESVHVVFKCHFECTLEN